MAGMETAHRIVSSEAEELILVDGDDNEIGYESMALVYEKKANQPNRNDAH